MTLGGRWRGSHPAPTFVPRRVAVAVGVPVAGWAELTTPPTPFENGAPNYAVALNDGTVLVGAGDSAPSHFWIYNPGTDSYSSTGSGDAGGTYANLDAGAFLASHAFAVSDSGNGTERFDSGSWTTRAARGGSASPTACTDGTYLYVLDGGNFRRFDPGANSWAALSYPPIGASYSAIVCDGTSIWLFDWASGGGTSKYTIGAGTWDSGSALAPMPTPRGFVACGIIGGKAYLAGGGVSGSQSDALEIYDLAGDSWTTGPTMGTTLATASGAVVSGRLYVFGVTGSPGFAATARVYTP